MKNSSVVPAGLVGAILGLGLVAGCQPGQVMPASDRPECPHHWDFTRIKVTTSQRGEAALKTLGGNPGELSAPRHNTNVPEFHDCQRLVRGSGTDATYDSLVAVFASDTMADTGLVHAPPPPPSGGAWLVPLVEVVSWGGSYDALGIRPGFGCLYVPVNDTLSTIAFMVPFGAVEQDCHAPRPYHEVRSAPNSRPLRLHRVTYPGLTWADYPPVARWDWDTLANTQVIGFKCASAWCEVGAYGSEVRTADNLLARLGPAGASALAGAIGVPSLTRVLTVKGWYDEQRLAPPDATWGSGAPDPMPMDLRGTLIPVGTLERMKVGDFGAHWRVVAAVLLDQFSPEYRAKYNYLPMEGTGRVTTISLCQERDGTRACPEVPNAVRAKAACGPEAGTTPPLLWWARTEATDGTMRYWCMVRRGHSGGDDVPGTARWRWLADDETTWARCDRGCCTTQ